MASKEKVIKFTTNGKFHSMGLVVDTWEEAVERCERKGNTNNIFLVFPKFAVKDSNGKIVEAETEICGTPDYLKQFI